jgi:hypothetical protein
MINFTIDNSFVLVAIDETKLEVNAAADRNGEVLSVVITVILRTFFSGLSMDKDF